MQKTVCYGRSGRWRLHGDNMVTNSYSLTKKDVRILDKLVKDGVFTNKSEAIRHGIKLLVKDSILIDKLIEASGDVINIDGCAYKLVKKKEGVVDG